ncbi:MAG TPA: GntR family transcriptional regulator [Candidatus Dormibacteraeota bacterium]|nr:GntR family transcriptional regulator [Candidatus Dormibacteraeota bacterium]
MGTALDREGPTPLYQQLADLLRQEIAAGRLPSGVAFPSERKLMGRYAVTRTTVRSALGVLRQEGLVVAEHGAGSFVRDPGGARRRVDGRRVGRPPAPVPGERAYRPNAPFGGPYEHRRPSRWIAELLEVAEGEAVLVQDNASVYPEGLPGISRSWLHPRVEREQRIPWAEVGTMWLVELLQRHGITATEGEDVVGALMPTPELKQLLHLSDGVPVLHLARILREGERIVGLIEIAMPGDQAALTYPLAELPF